ncbi:MAG TPA: condensation domain-containing protein [Micromonosporaceae bacterium]
MTSYSQDEVWFLNQLGPTAPVFNLSRVFRVTGALQLDAVRNAWRRLLRRHEILSTTVVEAGGQPQVGRPDAEAGQITFVDLGHLSRSDALPQAERLCSDWTARAIPLAQGPLARLSIVRVHPFEHRLVVSLHQAVADEPSMSIVLDELSVTYAHSVDPTQAGRILPEPARQFAEFAREQRTLERSPAYHRMLAWWTAMLTPPPPVLELPVDRARSPAAFGPLGSTRFEWGGQLASRLAEFCQAEGTTPSVVLLAAFQAVLARHSGQDQVCVGLPVSTRPSTGFEQVVGPFVNVLPVVANLSGQPSFRQLLRHLGQVHRDAGFRKEIPFNHLVRSLNLGRDPRRMPLCDVWFRFGEPARSSLRLARAVVQPLADPARPVRADLFLTVSHAEPMVAGRLDFRSDLFEPATVELLLDQLHTLLIAGLDDPGRPVHRLPLAQPHRLRAEAAAADRVGGASAARLPVHDLISDRARQLPEAEAVTGAEAALSYRELERRAALVARLLGSLGPVPGRPVAVRMSPGPDQVAASVGILRAGGYLLWFGTQNAGERGRAVLAEQRPMCLLIDRDPERDDLARWYRDECDGTVIDLSRAVMADDVGPGAVADPDDARRLDVTGADPLARIAYVAYTSGSTGKPKGIAQSQAAFAQFVSWMADAFDLGPGSRVAQWAAPEHDPSLCEVFATLVSGATLCPVPDRLRAHPEKLVDWLAEQRITFLQTVPSFARELLKVIAGAGQPDRLRALDRLVLMGEAVPADLVNGLRAALPWARLANVYGPTETIAATWHDIAAPMAATVPIGASIPGRQVLLLDQDDELCPTGITGQIVIHSPYVADGYLGVASPAFLPPSTLEISRPGSRWYRTGDLGRRRPDGLLEFRGRMDFQVKLYGNRIELAEVEATLAELESVVECAVVALHDPDGLVSRLVAYVVPHTPGELEPGRLTEQWRAHLRRRFGASMVLVSFLTLEQRLPRNVGGKVDRRRLPDPRLALATTQWAPGTEVERGMVEIWQDLLGGVPLEPETNFFAAGGHSLMLAQLRDRIRSRFGVEVALWDAYVNPSLRGICHLVDSAGPRRFSTP